MHWLERCWYHWHWQHLFLLPLSVLFGLARLIRLALYACNIKTATRLPVPVVVIGNIHVGGTGKTPLTIWLANQLQSQGFHVGIVSRGYGAAITHPTAVTPQSRATDVGDEPLLLAQKTQAPVWVHPKRALAGQALLQAHPNCQVLICDDGLQHIALARDFEIAVLDGVRGWGFNALLPAGPLREPRRRLQKVDALVCNGQLLKNLPKSIPHYLMQLHTHTFYRLNDPQQQAVAADFAGKTIAAVAGIGHPQRFFNTLSTLGLRFSQHPYPDHHTFRASDIPQEADVIILTEKDAVKCVGLNHDKIWVLPVTADLPTTLVTQITSRLQLSR